METRISSTPARRDYIDVLKGFGILCVVTGHFCEYHRGTLPQINALFECIYLFHMPLFCIASGLVARFNPRKILLQQVWLYFLSQAVMLCFRVICIRDAITLLDFFVPWRHMWYLYALILWSLTLPLLQAARRRPLSGRFAALAAAVAVGLSGGLVEWPFALGRVFSFFPFFALGVLFSDWMDRWHDTAARNRPLRAALLAGLLAFYGLTFRYVMHRAEPAFEGERLFQSASYAAGNYAMADRAVFYLVSAATVLVMVGLATTLPHLAALGQRTLPLYILHMPLYELMIQLGCYQATAEKGWQGVLLWLGCFIPGAVCALSSWPVCKAMDFLCNLWYETLPGLRQRLAGTGTAR